MDSAGPDCGRAFVGMLWFSVFDRSLGAGFGGRVDHPSWAGTGQNELSGLSEDASEVDTPVAGVALDRIPLADRRSIPEVVSSVWLRRVHRRRKSCRFATNKVSRSGLHTGKVSQPAQETQEESESCQGKSQFGFSTCQAGKQADDVDHNAVACDDGVGVELAAGSLRQQRTGTSTRDVGLVAA